MRLADIIETLETVAARERAERAVANLVIPQCDLDAFENLSLMAASALFSSDFDNEAFLPVE